MWVGLRHLGQLGVGRGEGKQRTGRGRQGVGRGEGGLWKESRQKSLRRGEGDQWEFPYRQQGETALVDGRAVSVKKTQDDVETGQAWEREGVLRVVNLAARVSSRLSGPFGKQASYDFAFEPMPSGFDFKSVCRTRKLKTEKKKSSIRTLETPSAQ